MKVMLEYIWLDGYADQNVRSKTKVVTVKEGDTLGSYPDWTFDGSSTNQADGSDNTDCVLKPVFSCPDPFRGGIHKLIFCEVYEADGETPHSTNVRRKLADLVEGMGFRDRTFEEVPWFGWEQEYTLTKKEHPFTSEVNGANEKPLGHDGPLPRPQGEYYCGVGSDNVIGREIAERHMQLCLAVGINVSGINAEVMLGQWEYQVGPVGALDGSDQLWVSRYILHRVAENYGVKVSFHPKPLTGDWNGSGCHVNFSTASMRSENGIEEIKEAIANLEVRHSEHMDVYGNDNDKRMSGEHETSSYDEFSFGNSTRNTSIRVPAQTVLDGKGYFEDRRPASNCDPYKVAHIMLETVFSKDLVDEVRED